MSRRDLKLFVAIGLDPIDRKLVVLGVGETYDEAKRGLGRATDDYTYRLVFSALKNTASLELREWLRSKGLTSQNAHDTAVEFYRQLNEITEGKDAPNVEDH